jgi:mannan endo-1,4-beta-mannosidase
MKLITQSFLGLLLSSLSMAAPTNAITLVSPSVDQPPVAYPIGTKNGGVKARGRLFEIDGNVEYFAGKEHSI